MRSEGLGVPIGEGSDSAEEFGVNIEGGRAADFSCAGVEFDLAADPLPMAREVLAGALLYLGTVAQFGSDAGRVLQLLRCGGWALWDGVSPLDGGAGAGEEIACRCPVASPLGGGGLVHLGWGKSLGLQAPNESSSIAAEFEVVSVFDRVGSSLPEVICEVVGVPSLVRFVGGDLVGVGVSPSVAALLHVRSVPFQVVTAGLFHLLRIVRCPVSFSLCGRFRVRSCMLRGALHSLGFLVLLGFQPRLTSPFGVSFLREHLLPVPLVVGGSVRG